MDKLVSIQEAAEILNISPMTLRRWDDSGKLPAVRLGARGDRKYQLSVIKKILENRNNFTASAMQNFLDSGLMYYAYEEEKDFHYKFTLPENPLGCSELVRDALGKLSEINISNYPPVSGTMLAAKIAKIYNIPKETILVGAGAGDLLHLAFISTINPDEKVLIPEITFPATEFLALLTNAEILISQMDDEFDVDYDDLEKIIQVQSPKIVSLCNPNNPTGKILNKEKTLRLVESYKNCLFIIDEANVEYCSQTFIHEAIKLPNLLVVRSFSKGFGLAGLRVGYIVGDKKVIYTLYRRQTPFSVNSIGLKLAEKALDDLDHIEKTKEFITSERNRLEQSFHKNGFATIPSDSNYLLIKVKGKFADSKLCVSYLNSKGINVVDGRSFRGLDDEYIRICPQKKEENDYLIEAISNIDNAEFSRE